MGIVVLHFIDESAEAQRGGYIPHITPEAGKCPYHESNTGLPGLKLTFLTPGPSKDYDAQGYLVWTLI